MNEYLLTDEMKNQNPFMGGEKLYYLTDSLEQLVFNVSERDNKVHEVPYGQRTNIWDLYEVDKTYIGSNKNGHFFLEMHYNAGYYYKIAYTFENQGNTFISELPLNKEDIAHVDSLKILEQWYYDIFVYEGDTTDIFIIKGDTIDNYAYKFYYSTQSGIVKIDFLDDSYLQLEKIEW